MIVDWDIVILLKVQLSNEMGVGFLTIAKSVSYECNLFRIYDYI